MIGFDKKHKLVIVGFAFAMLLALTLGGRGSAMGESPLRVLILPFHVVPGDHEKGLQDFADHVDRRLRSEIGSMGGKLSVEGEVATRKLLHGRGAPVTERDAIDLASKSGSDVVVYGFLSGEGNQYRLRGIMWDLGKGRASVSTDLKVDNMFGLPGVLQVFLTNINRRMHGTPRLPFYKAGKSKATGGRHPNRMSTTVGLNRDTGPWRSPDIVASLRALDIGDMDGDNKNETVFVSPGGVTISRFERGTLRTLAQFSHRPADYISAEVEDVDGDGVAELLLCYQTPAGIESALIRYVNRNFKVAGKFPHTILGTVADPTDEKKRMLLGQRTDSKDMFSGQMTRFRTDGMEIAPDGKVMLPPGTLLLSYVSARLGKDSDPLRIILNQDQRLMVFDRENRLLYTVPDRIYGLDRSIRIMMKGEKRKITLPGRLLVTDSTGDGENELLVIKHSSGSSVIQALVWDGEQLRVKWKTVRSPGMISDFRIRDFKNGGSRSLVLLLVRFNPFLALTGGARSVIYAYDLTQ